MRERQHAALQAVCEEDEERQSAQGEPVHCFANRQHFPSHILTGLLCAAAFYMIRHSVLQSVTSILITEPWLRFIAFKAAQGSSDK